MTMSDPHVHHPTDTPKDHHGGQHGEHVRALYVIYAWLMILLVLTVAAAEVKAFNFGRLNIWIAMTIAVIKAGMVVWVFMHVKYGGKLLWVFAVSSFVWLAILLTYTIADYHTRSHEGLVRAEQYQTEPIQQRRLENFHNENIDRH